MRLTEDLAELTGTIIGDGCLYGNHGKYLIMISGHPIDDKKYYNILSDRIFKIINYRAKMKVHQRALRLIIQNKGFYKFFVEDLNMKYNGKKTYNVVIPDKILKNIKYTSACLRGIVDTDGSVFTSNKKGSLNYPALEITTVSKKLAVQIFDILKFRNFRIKIRSFQRNNSKVKIYTLSLYGWGMLRKWYNEIGFTNPTKKSKAERILKKKYGGTSVI